LAAAEFTDHYTSRDRLFNGSSAIESQTRADHSSRLPFDGYLLGKAQPDGGNGSSPVETIQ
jgi:hypothetical protein